MIRMRLFGRCRIYHDPVSPVMKEPAEIGWSALYRTIDLVTPRKLKGKELLMRTKGWWTVDPSGIAPIVERHGRLVVGDKGELMVEMQNEEGVKVLSRELADNFGDQVMISP